MSEVSDCEPNGMLKEKTAPAEWGLCPLPLDADDEEAALDREEEGVSPPVVSMTRCGTGGGRVTSLPVCLTGTDRCVNAVVAPQ